jgi:hypothetical protein
MCSHTVREKVFSVGYAKRTKKNVLQKGLFLVAIFVIFT